MTTSITASISDGQPVRKILGWLDDDDRDATTDEVVEFAPRTDECFMGLFRSVAPPAADVHRSSRPPVESLGMLAPLVSTLDYCKVRDFNDTAAASSWLEHIAAQGIKTRGTTAMWPATNVGSDCVFTPPAIAGLMGYRYFYSSVLPELAQIELTIESINQTMRDSVRKFVSAYVRDHGHAYYGVVVDDDFESAGLAYTDHLGDYPPLTRVYEDVTVVMGSENEIERPVYTDEDYQVWGT